MAIFAFVELLEYTTTFGFIVIRVELRISQRRGSKRQEHRDETQAFCHPLILKSVPRRR
jgi:hypothetical protein